MSIDTLPLFLAHAIRLEEDSAINYDAMADALEVHGKSPVARLFRKMAHYSRLHLAEAEGRAAGLDLPRLKTWEYQWPGDDSPENAPADESDYAMNERDALILALKGEKGALAFYASVMETSGDTGVADLAKEFVEEESEHVSILEDWLARAPETGRFEDLDPPIAIG
ncbi:ferritin family protein [Oleispirillum naphthae]|uniref:ferritin-like domain-containing protein n=1 Tax=Oleispirillum naphthae TaxID=2838853 RepID=UPI0030825755